MRFSRPRCPSGVRAGAAKVRRRSTAAVEMRMYGDMFKGKVAVVTGGARGIGLACAQSLSSLGASVALWDRDAAEATKAAGEVARGAAVGMDVTSEADVARALAETEKALGPVDILVASAGITGPNKTVADYG